MVTYDADHMADAVRVEPLSAGDTPELCRRSAGPPQPGGAIGVLAQAVAVAVDAGQGR
jgi:hypothetical protein